MWGSHLSGFVFPHAQGLDKEDHDTTSDAPEQDETDSAMCELMTLVLEGPRLGCAKYSPLTCTVEVFEAAVLLSVEGNNRTGLASRDNANQRTLPILTQDDIPSSLLWLVQVLEAHRPLIFLPSEGSQPLVEICQILGFTPSWLSRKSAFNSSDAIPQLLRMYPHLTMSEIASRFNLSHKTMLSAMSALLKYSSVVQSNIRDVVERMPCGIMYIDASSSRWLQLARTERHPCAHQGVGRPKEGLSLLSVVDQTVSAPGRALLRQWFALPSCDPGELQQRRQAVRYFSTPDRRETLRQLRHTLGRIHPADPAFTMMRRGKATLRHYQLLLRTMQALMALHSILFPIAHEVDFLRTLMDSLSVESIRRMASMLENSIFGISQSGQPNQDRSYAYGAKKGGDQRGDDFLSYLACTASRNLGKNNCCTVTLQWGVDSILDELRQHYACLPSALEKISEESALGLLRDMDGGNIPLQKAMRTFQCVYLEPLGYVLRVDEESFISCLTHRFGVAEAEIMNFQDRTQSSPDLTGIPAENIHNRYPSSSGPAGIVLSQFCEAYGWDHVHVSEGLLYFKTSRTKELDAYVGDLMQRMIMRENDVRRELEGELLRCSLSLLTPTQPLAGLDCLLSFAYCASEYHWVCPQLVRKRGVVHIVDGWHPVLQQVLGANELVSFTFHVEDMEEQVCVVTGLSGSGKSVLISSIAQIIILAQLGSFVPSRHATLGIFGYIFTCNAGAVDQGMLSSFQSECVQMNRILRHCAYERTSAALAFSEGTKGPHINCEETSDNSRADTAIMNTDTPHHSNIVVPDVGLMPECHLAGTLILMDDIGRGTTSQDAMALLSAILHYLTGQEVPQPATDDFKSNDGRTTDVHTGYSCCKAGLVCPTVLCTTRFYELMELDQRCLSTARMCVAAFSDGSTYANTEELLRPELLHFSFPRVAFYDLPCMAVYPDQKRPRRSCAEPEADGREFAFEKGVSCSLQHDEKGVNTGELPIDVVPTYRLRRVTARRDCHGECGVHYQEYGSYAGPAMARRCNILPSLLAYWMRGLKILSSAALQENTGRT